LEVDDFFRTYGHGIDPVVLNLISDWTTLVVDNLHVAPRDEPEFVRFSPYLRAGLSDEGVAVKVKAESNPRLEAKRGASWMRRLQHAIQWMIPETSASVAIKTVLIGLPR
jgi:hypothetical protein